MRLIRKGAEPPLLLAYRKTEGARYGGLPADAKTELRTALVRDQHGLCCFCMQRVEATVAPELKVKIAHWMPQHVDGSRDLESRDLEWTNRLAACPGNEGAPFARQHCDTRQGNRELRISPREPTHIKSLSYTTRGEIRTSRDDLRDDLDEKLNLNNEALCGLRKEAVRRMLDTLGLCRGDPFSEAALRRALERCSTPDASGNLPPFAGALEWWLRRRLGERSSWTPASTRGPGAGGSRRT
jgi:uncharacterized protein (TIGR02646 family)